MEGADAALGADATGDGGGSRRHLKDSRQIYALEPVRKVRAPPPSPFTLSPPPPFLPGASPGAVSRSNVKSCTDVWGSDRPVCATP